MDTAKTDDKKNFATITGSNMGYPMILNCNNYRDPFNSDANGFTRDSDTHNMYKVKIKSDYGPENSFKTALATIKSKNVLHDCFELFTCPLCGLCFIHPKRFLIHFKWHHFGLLNIYTHIDYDCAQNLQYTTCANSIETYERTIFCSLCSDSFYSTNELRNHLEMKHGLLSEIDETIQCSTSNTNHSNENISTNLKKSDSDKIKLRRKITIEVKKQIISDFENGVRITDLSTQFGIPKSTIGTILKKKEIIKKADVAKGVRLITKQRSQLIEEVEKLLLIWLNEKQLAGDRVSYRLTIAKAKRLHDELLIKNPEMSSNTESFKASRGWFENFKKRSGIHNALRHKEAANTDKKFTENYVQEFNDYVKAEGFLPQQIFNCDETSLFWKKLPSKSYITQEEKKLVDNKPIKDRLTLLLCGNASGDFKVKPLLVYHSESQGVFKENNVINNKFSVMLRCNSKAWVTRQFFIEWTYETFAPSVKKYLQEKKLPLKCLLLMDNAPAHPLSLHDELNEDSSFITLKFLPIKVTPLIQPMAQQIISNFKKLYFRAFFQKCFEFTSETELTLRDFWNDHFNIFHCLSLVDKAWDQMTSKTMKSAWRKLLPDCMTDIEGFEAESVLIVDEIVSIANSMGLKVNNADVEELVEDFGDELTTEELNQLHNEQQMSVKEELLKRDKRKKHVPSFLIEEMCAKWSEVQSFVERHHPDKTLSSRVINMFNDNAITHFRNILKCRKKQSKLERVIVRPKCSK